MAGDDSRREARQRFIREFVRPRGLDRNAGEVAADAIDMFGKGKSIKDIDLALQ